MIYSLYNIDYEVKFRAIQTAHCYFKPENDDVEIFPDIVEH